VKELWRRLTAAFGNLSGRERMLVSCALAGLSLAVLYAAVMLPVLGYGERVQQDRESQGQQLEAMRRLQQEFADVSQRLSSVEERIQKGSRGNLRTSLESLARKSMVKIESMEPQASPANDQYRETKVEVGLKGVTLPQSVRYLHQIESAAQVHSIKSLRIRTRSDHSELLDVTFTVSSFERL